MQHPTITIIVPVFNCETTIEACLNSILVQEPRDFELILVYTPSKDNTLIIIDKVKKDDKRVRLVIQKKRGRGAARNLGIKKAKGEILVWTDSDCVVPKNWLKRIIKPIVEDGESIVQGNDEPLFENFWARLTHKSSLKTKAYFKNDRRCIDAFNTKNLAIRKDLLQKVGFFNDDFVAVEDYELKIRLKMNNYDLRYLNNLKVKHDHRDSIGKIIKQRTERGYWAAITYYLHRDYLDSLEIEDHISDKQLKNQAANPLKLFFYLNGPIRFFRYTFHNGPSLGMFVLLCTTCTVFGNFKGRMNKNKELSLMGMKEKG